MNQSPMQLCSSEQLDQLATALSAAQGEFPQLVKDETAKAGSFSYKYIGLPAVVSAAAPILAKHGLAVSQHPESDRLTTMLLHQSGQWLSSVMALNAKDKTPQAIGSAITYARRYSYMAVLGLVADEDDDGVAASKVSTARTPNATAPPTQQPATPAPASQAQSWPDQTTLKATTDQILGINKQADGKKLTPAQLANIVKQAAGAEPVLWEKDADATAWLDRALPKLPAKLLGPIGALIGAA